MGLIIDTNVFIALENGRYELSALEKFTEYGDTFIAAVSVAELYMGVHLATNEPSRITREVFVENIVAVVPCLSFNQQVARVYARIYSAFIKPRKKTGASVHDLQIAATAIAYGYPVLTSNSRDFEKIPGVQVLVP